MTEQDQLSLRSFLEKNYFIRELITSVTASKGLPRLGHLNWLLEF